MKQLLSRQQIEHGVEQLADELTTKYGTRPLTIVGILTGSLVMLADLMRHLEMPLRVALIHASSYRGPATTRSALRVNDKLLPDLRGRDVLVVDDIFDTGHTLVEVIAQLAKHQPATLQSAVLLRKAGRCEVAIEPDYVVFEIPNEFVVGYGLDYDDMHRNLPNVMALEPEDVESSEG